MGYRLLSDVHGKETEGSSMHDFWNIVDQKVFARIVWGWAVLWTSSWRVAEHISTVAFARS